VRTAAKEHRLSAYRRARPRVKAASRKAAAREPWRLRSPIMLAMYSFLPLGTR
jgi:hypothetical protein